MSGGLPDAKPWASCCPRSDATMTLTLMPVFFVHADVATLTAFVSAGPELPISAVISVAWVFAGPFAVAVLRRALGAAAPSVVAEDPPALTPAATTTRAITVRNETRLPLTTPSLFCGIPSAPALVRWIGSLWAFRGGFNRVVRAIPGHVRRPPPRANADD